MGDENVRREPSGPPDPGTSAPAATDSRRVWALPAIVDRGSILEIVRATTGPSSDFMGPAMKPTLGMG